MNRLLIAAAWCAALATALWQRLLAPALAAAFPGSLSLFLSESHETRPSDPSGSDLSSPPIAAAPDPVTPPHAKTPPAAASRRVRRSRSTATTAPRP